MWVPAVLQRGNLCPEAVLQADLFFFSFFLNSTIVVVAKQNSNVCTAPLIPSGLYPVVSISHVRVAGSFLFYQSEVGCRSAQPGATSAALVSFDREGEKSRGKFGDLLEISSSPIKEPCMYSSSAGNELSKKTGQAQRGSTAFTA